MVRLGQTILDNSDCMHNNCTNIKSRGWVKPVIVQSEPVPCDDRSDLAQT